MPHSRSIDQPHTVARVRDTEHRHPQDIKNTNQDDYTKNYNTKHGPNTGPQTQREEQQTMNQQQQNHCLNPYGEKKKMRLKMSSVEVVFCK